MHQKKQRKSDQQADGKRSSSCPGLKSKRNRYILYRRKTRTIVGLYALWIVALAIFVAGLSSASGFHFFTLSGSKSSPQVENSSPSTAPSPIFRVDGILIADSQWHQAVQSAFSTLVSSPQFPGGSQTDSEVINTKAMHLILDPLAMQEIVKELGLPTSVNVLFHQWLAQASSQEQQIAQANLNNLNYQQQKAQEQLKRDIVIHFTTFPMPTAKEIYTYYVQHPSYFARIAPQMHVQQLVVNSRQMAEQAVSQLEQGTLFSVVEASYDVSGAYYTAHEGDLGWITLGGSGFPPEWTANVLLLQTGQVGTPFLVDGKYYIVKCIEGPNYEPWPFSLVQEQARADLVSERLNTAFAHFLAQHESSMKIVLLDQRYAPILQNFVNALKQG